MKYEVQVVMSYWQTIDVEADSAEDAKYIAFEAFDITKADIGEGEAYNITLLDKVQYVVRNHNGTVLGVFDNDDEADWEAQEYMYQTGNTAYVDKENANES